MRPVGRVPSNFKLQVYLVASNFCNWLLFFSLGTVASRPDHHKGRRKDAHGKGIGETWEPLEGTEQEKEGE